MEYFSAEEALNKSRQSKDDKCNVVLDYIFKCIENAIKNGDTSIHIHLLQDEMKLYPNCSLRVLSKLKSLGYKAKEIRGSAYDTNPNTLFVSWLNPEMSSGFRCLG
jgi:hypothetical protein